MADGTHSRTATLRKHNAINSLSTTVANTRVLAVKKKEKSDVARNKFALARE